MRKIELARRGSRDTPVRRSTRLQQEKVDEQDSRETPDPAGRYANDILTPRESIRAYRKQKVTLVEAEPSSVPLRGPLPLPKAETPKDPQQTEVERDAPLSPVVKLRRLDVALEEEPSPPKELPKPSIDWEEVKDRQEHLPEPAPPKPQSTLAQRLMGRPRPILQGKPAAKTASFRRPQAMEEVSSRLKRLAMREMPDLSKFAAAGASAKKQAKYLQTPSFLGFLLILLILVFACWILWEYRSSGTFLGLTSLAPWGWNSFSRLWSGAEACSSQCSLVLVESIPDTLDYESLSPHHPSIYQAWMELLAEANSSVEIAAFYFTLRDSDIHVKDPSSEQGRAVFKALKELPARGVKLSIAVNSPMFSENNTRELANHGADVWYVDMKRLTEGVLHTKLWVVDQKHIYIGSANMDWRSLTQVKELGAVIYNCSCFASDLHRIFAIYRLLGETASIPAVWPSDLAAESSLSQPLSVELNGTAAQLYFSSSPPALCSTGRTTDLSAILSTINDAQQFVYIAVMAYEPQCSFCKPKRFWPAIDDALRAAACDRHVKVQLLVSCWPHSRREMFAFLESLVVLHHARCPIEVKLFVVPTGGEVPPIPYSYVNHNKYMVTDRLAYIGTSNWSEDYFVNTAGVGLVVNQSESSAGPPQPTLRQQLEEVFLRDWNSAHALPLTQHPTCAKK